MASSVIHSRAPEHRRTREDGNGKNLREGRRRSRTRSEHRSGHRAVAAMPIRSTTAGASCQAGCWLRQHERYLLHARVVCLFVGLFVCFLESGREVARGRNAEGNSTTDALSRVTTNDGGPRGGPCPRGMTHLGEGGVVTRSSVFPGTRHREGCSPLEGQHCAKRHRGAELNAPGSGRF